MPVGQVDEVVEVAAHRPLGLVVRGDLPAGQVRGGLRQEVLLDQLGHLELVLHALPAAGLRLLLPDQLGHAHGGGGLGGQVLQQLAVVRRVLLLGQPRSQVQHADQLALGHQGDHQAQAHRAHVLQGRRVQLQLFHVHRPRGALQVREQGVVRCDVERRSLRPLRRRGRTGRLYGRLPVGPTAAPSHSRQDGCHSASCIQRSAFGNRYGSRHGGGNCHGCTGQPAPHETSPPAARSHRDAWAGCIVSRTTSRRWTLRSSRSTSSRSRDVKDSSVRVAS